MPLTPERIADLIEQVQYVSRNGGNHGIYWTPPESCKDRSDERILANAIEEILVALREALPLTTLK